MKLTKRKKIIIGILLIILIMIPMVINCYVINKTKNRIVFINDIHTLKDIDAILVLGCKANKDGPSLMLKHRLDMGISSYFLFSNMKILLSGDHGHFEYDEVNTMRDYVLKKNIPSKDVFMDHAGFSTYDSIYRAKEIFGINKMIIVTQEYHLYRALYIAQELGLDAYGISAEKIDNNQIIRDIREVLARNKDFIKAMIKPKSTYLGDKISIKGNGNLTIG